MRLLKNFLIGLGCLLIGFGAGVISTENFQIEKTNYYWLIVIASLVLGGFLMALGIVKKVSPSLEETEPQKE
jgi:hypothetical protein